MTELTSNEIDGVPAHTPQTPSPGTPLLRQPRLLPVLTLAALLPLLSWVNPFLAATFNRWLGRTPDDDSGWMAYTALRVLLFGLLVWSVFRLKPADTTAPTQHTSPSHAPAFDPLMGLRALAAILVLLGHYFTVVFPYRSPAGTFGHLLYTAIRSCPWAGVWLFFTLSGFLMAKGFATGRYPLTSAGIYRFYRNRWLKILPLYLGAVLLIAPLVRPALFLPVHWWRLLQIVTFDYRSDVPLNPIGALWSVSTEVQFYFLVPFLFPALVLVRRSLGTAFPLGVALLLGVGILFRRAVLYFSFHAAHPLPGPLPWDTFGYMPLLPNLDLFLTGMCIAFFQPSPRWRSIPVPWLRAVLVVLAAVAFLVNFSTGKLLSAHLKGPLFTDSEIFWQCAPAFVCLLAALYIAVAQTAGRIPLRRTPGGLVLRGIHRTAVLTYALYVFHPSLMESFRTVLPSGLLQPHTALLYFPLVMALVWAVAHCVYEFIERPFEGKKHVAGSALTDAP